MSAARWVRITLKRERLVYVMPIDDLRTHVESEFCWCKPDIERRQRWRIIAHNAMDGRELVERHGLQ